MENAEWDEVMDRPQKQVFHGPDMECPQIDRDAWPTQEQIDDKPEPNYDRYDY